MNWRMGYMSKVLVVLNFQELQFMEKRDSLSNFLLSQDAPNAKCLHMGLLSDPHSYRNPEASVKKSKLAYTRLNGCSPK